MADIAKLDNLSIDDLASLWNVDKADIAKVMGLDIGVAGDLSAGPSTIYNLGETAGPSVTAMDSTHAIVTYRDYIDSEKGKAVCLTLSGTTITAGSETTFYSGETHNTSVTKMNNTHAIVTYRDQDDSRKGKAVCLTLSGTTITAGSPTTFESGDVSGTSVTTMDSTHAIVAYREQSGSFKGKAVCLTLSGTTITAGSETTFYSGDASNTIVTAMDSTHAIVIYRDEDDSNKGKAICLTLSGTTITTGTTTTFRSGYTDSISVTTMDNTHVIVAYRDQDDSDRAKAICLTLSGSSITYGSPTTFELGDPPCTSITAMDSTHAIVTYEDRNDSEKGKAVCLTLSGTTITAGSPITFESRHTTYSSVITMDRTHAIVTYRDDDNGLQGKTVCITLS